MLTLQISKQSIFESFGFLKFEHHGKIINWMSGYFN